MITDLLLVFIGVGVTVIAANTWLRRQLRKHGSLTIRYIGRRRHAEGDYVR